MSTIPLKALPDPDKNDIIPPDMDYSYFEKPGRLKPDFKDTEFSSVNAWWFAECAFLSYCHPGFARMAWKLAGFEGFRFFQGKGTECMVSWNRKALIVSFRGTELKSRSAFHEIATDLNAQPVPFEEGGKVHKAFWTAWKRFGVVQMVWKLFLVRKWLKKRTVPSGLRGTVWEAPWPPFATPEYPRQRDSISTELPGWGMTCLSLFLKADPSGVWNTAVIPSLSFLPIFLPWDSTSRMGEP